MINNDEYFYQNPSAGFDGRFNWDYLSTAFGYGNGIQPMDIDACVERCGHILMFETKTTGAIIPHGQYRTFETFHKMGCTILFIWMDKLDDEEYGYPVKDIDNITKIQLWRPNKVLKTIRFNTDETPKQVLWRICNGWYNNVNKYPRIF